MAVTFLEATHNP